jgi:maleylacetoacetate isomerase
MVTKDAHPFLVPRVRKYLEEELHLDESSRMKWLRPSFDAGSRAIEDVLARDPRTGRFCYGDRLTITDFCLVAHLTSAKMLFATAGGRTSGGATLREYKIRPSALP